MRRNWIIFFCGVLLAIGSLAGALVNEDQRATYVRGWEDATVQLEMPLRLPLAGINVELSQYAGDGLSAELQRIADAGFTWVRQPFRWDQIELQPGEYDWSTYDAIVATVDTFETLEIVAVIDGTPAWARNPLAPDHPFAPPASVSDYAVFAGAVASRYAISISQYQIWDEPNITLHWGNLDPRPAHYAAMLRGAYNAIHASDPSASVIAAALAPTTEKGPTNINEVDFLRALYEQGARGFFDAVAGKPYGFDTPPDNRTVDPDVLNFSRIILLREEMVRQGDGDKPLWGSNFGWNSLPDIWTGPPSIWGSVTLLEQQIYTQDAYVRAATEWPWMAGLILQHWDPDAPTDDPIQGFAIAARIQDWENAQGWSAPDGLISGAHSVDNPFTTYSENWRFSDLGVDAEIVDPGDVSEQDENRIEVRFYGTDFALPVRRDDYLAYLYVSVDGEPANALPANREGESYLILTSPERTPAYELIRVAHGLPEALHTVEIIHRPYNGDDRWPIGGYAVASAPDDAQYRRDRLIAVVCGIAALLMVTYAAVRLPWQQVRAPSPDWFRRAREWLAGLAASVLVLIGALLTWGDALQGLLRRDPPALAITVLTAGLASLSPVALVTIAALAVIFVLIYNRPLIGVLLTIFWSAFFLSSLDLLIRLFATVEVYLVMTILAVALRAGVEWARQRQQISANQNSLLRDLRSIRPNLLDALILAFVALACLSLTWSEFTGVASRQLRVVIIEPAVLYGLLRVMKLDRRDVMWMADMLLFAGSAIAFVGLALFATGEGVVETEGTRRLIGVYGSPNGIGLYLGRAIPFALAYAVLLPRSSWRKLGGAVGGVVMLLAVLLSQSRGAILLGIPAAVAVMLILWRGRRAVLPLVLALGGIGLALLPLSLVLPRLSNLLGDTAFFRTQLWYSSINLVREHPITGVGLDQFLYWYRSRYLLPEAWAEPNLSIPHNVLLNFWANLGVFGVLIGGALVVLFWRDLWRFRFALHRDQTLWLAITLGLAGSMADALAHGLVDVTYFSINLAFVFFLSLGILQWLHDPPEALARKTD